MRTVGHFPQDVDEGGDVAVGGQDADGVAKALAGNTKQRGPTQHSTHENQPSARHTLQRVRQRRS